MNKGIVDVILPIYKPNNTIFNAIDSIINQAYNKWILHIVDDASGDNSFEKIKKKYGNFNDKIKYYQLKKNRRQAFARNFAISQSDGEYIAFIDQDDVWVKEKLYWQVKQIIKSNVDAIHGNLQFIDIEGNIIFKEKAKKENLERSEIEWKKISNIELARKIFLKSNIRIISSLVKRNIFENIGGFKDQFFGGEDETFWFEISLYGRIGYDDRGMFYRGMHNSNAVKTYYRDRLLGYLKSTKYIRKNYQDIISKIYHIKHQEILSKLIRNSLHNKSFKFLIYALRLLKNYPNYFFQKAYISINK